MDITSLYKQGKNMVVELDDGVEYIVDERTFTDIKNGKNKVILIRVIDREPQIISVRRIMWGIEKDGVVDYINI